MGKNTRSCDECKYFLLIDEEGEEGCSEGMCRRFPPVLALPDIKNYTDGWDQPMVRGHCYCGEFRKV